MRSVSKGAGRAAVVLAVSTIVIAHGVLAAERQIDRGGFFDRLARTKQVIVKILSDIGLPPG